MLGRTDSPRRLLALLLVFGVFACALGGRLAYWQIGQAEELRTRAGQQSVAGQTERIRRGEILDTNGAVLATTAYRDRLVAYPDMLAVEDRAKVVEQVAAILGLDAAATSALANTFAAEAPYVVLSRSLTHEQSQQVRDGLGGDLYALGLEPQAVRFYPNDGGSPGTTLASQLLGFVTADGQGRYGIEQYGQDLLAGADGATANVGGDSMAVPTIGDNVTLTIDASLQLRLEKELYATWAADRAPRVTGLVMDPYTGAILAWASVPGYDANSYAQVAERSPELFLDPIVQEVYEPGSVMKMHTAAAALERGTVTIDTPVADGRALRIGENVVRNGDHGSIGVVPFEDIIAQSRNVGTGRVALDLAETTDEGAAILYEMWRRLGIGDSTGIDLGGEATGIVADPETNPWLVIDLVNRAFGQGVAVTPLQLARSFSAMVNGGRLPTPHVISAPGAEVDPGPQVLESDLSDTLRELMVHVVETGPHYADETLIPNYVVGGKTGTAQIWDPIANDWMPDTYNHTFAGFVGAERPEAVILVRIHDTEPRVRRSWGLSLEVTSNELFRRVAQDTIDVLEIPPLSDGPTPSMPASET